MDFNLDSSTSPRHPVSAWLCLPATLSEKTQSLLVFGGSGALFAIGWWCFLDAILVTANMQVVADALAPYIGLLWLPGIGGSLALFLLNTGFHRSALPGGERYATFSDEHEDGRRKCIAGTAFFVLVLAFVSLCGSILLYGQQLVPIATSLSPPDRDRVFNFGGQLLAQNILVFLSNLVIFYLRPEHDSFLSL